MLSSDLLAVLRRVLSRPIPAVDAARRDAELDALAAAHARAYGERASGRGRRWLLASGLTAAVAFGACVAPSDYEAEVGQRLAFTMAAASMSELDMHRVARYVEQEHDPEEIRIHGHAEIHRTADTGDEHTEEHVRVELEVIGEHLDADEIWDDLLREFPELASAEREDEALHGVVHGTLGGRLSHRLLDMTIDRDGVEAAKRQLLDDLAARGITGTPEIEIIDEVVDGKRHREVRVRIEQ